MGFSPTSASAATMFGKRSASTWRMSSQTASVAGALELGVDRQRHLVAGRELVDEALALRVVEERALAAHGLGHEKAVARALEAERGRMELHELEVGE